jgi:hypothetical protein
MTAEPTLAGNHPHERLIRIDVEHFAIRFLVPVLTVVVVILAHLLGTVMLDRRLGEGVNPSGVMLPFDIVILIGTGYLVERGLKQIMPSRRRATLSSAALVVTDGRRKPPVITRITWDKTVNVKAWRFPVKRRTRVPKGWYCMAVHLLQDEEELILYTFMSPQEAEATTGYTNFVRLRPRQETESNTDLSAVAEQRRLLKLEDSRWNDGAEIAHKDFDALLDILRQHVPGWA